MIKVQKEDFDVNKELKKLSENKNVGGISFFIGLVREDLSKDKCHSMTLQHYPETVSYTHLTLPTTPYV